MVELCLSIEYMRKQMQSTNLSKNLLLSLKSILRGLVKSKGLDGIGDYKWFLK